MNLASKKVATRLDADIAESMREQDCVVYVIDNDPESLDAISTLITAVHRRVQTFSRAEDFLNAYDGSPGCVVAEVSKPVHTCSGELQAKIDSLPQLIPVVFVTSFPKTSFIVNAMRAGAVTVLEKPYRNHELLEATQAALRIDRQRRTKRAQVDPILRSLQQLTNAETTVLDYILDGVTNKVIARRMEVNIRTVENRRRRIYEKMGTDSTAGLVSMVVEARTRSDSKERN